jgi:hypothetical protein
MKLTWLLGLTLLLALAACGSNPSPTVPTATARPAVNPTAVAPNQPAATTGTPATKAVSTTAAPEPTPAVPKETIVATSAAKATPTAAPVIPHPTATSSGPLAATIYVANCRSAPTTDKPGRVMVQISIEASGGNGKYRYFYQDKESPTKFIDVVGERGTRAIGEVRITSGDGQELNKEFDIGIGGLNCP